MKFPTDWLQPALKSSEQALRRTLPDARLQVTPLPTVEQIQLRINADYQTGPLPADVMQAVIARPAWSFAGERPRQHDGQNPVVVAGKRVADVGCGCGIGAIAAKMAGAKEVIACDNDRDALLSARTNAALNDVSVAFAGRCGLPEQRLRPYPHGRCALRQGTTHAADLQISGPNDHYRGLTGAVD